VPKSLERTYCLCLQRNRITFSRQWIPPPCRWGSKYSSKTTNKTHHKSL